MFANGAAHHARSASGFPRVQSLVGDERGLGGEEDELHGDARCSTRRGPAESAPFYMALAGCGKTQPEVRSEKDEGRSVQEL
jgi:hypothetical protein